MLQFLSLALLVISGTRKQGDYIQNLDTEQVEESNDQDNGIYFDQFPVDIQDSIVKSSFPKYDSSDSLETFKIQVKQYCNTLLLTSKSSSFQSVGSYCQLMKKRFEVIEAQQSHIRFYFEDDNDRIKFIHSGILQVPCTSKELMPFLVKLSQAQLRSISTLNIEIFDEDVTSNVIELLDQHPMLKINLKIQMAVIELVYQPKEGDWVMVRTYMTDQITAYEKFLATLTIYQDQVKLQFKVELKFFGKGTTDIRIRPHPDLKLIEEAQVIVVKQRQLPSSVGTTSAISKFLQGKDVIKWYLYLNLDTRFNQMLSLAELDGVVEQNGVTFILDHPNIDLTEVSRYRNKYYATGDSTYGTPLLNAFLQLDDIDAVQKFTEALKSISPQNSFSVSVDVRSVDQLPELPAEIANFIQNLPKNFPADYLILSSPHMTKDYFNTNQQLYINALKSQKQLKAVVFQNLEEVCGHVTSKTK